MEDKSCTKNICFDGFVKEKYAEKFEVRKLWGERQEVLKNELNINKVKIEFSHKDKTI